MKLEGTHFNPFGPPLRFPPKSIAFPSGPPPGGAVEAEPPVSFRPMGGGVAGHLNGQKRKWNTPPFMKEIPPLLNAHPPFWTKTTQVNGPLVTRGFPFFHALLLFKRSVAMGKRHPYEPTKGLAPSKPLVGGHWAEANSDSTKFELEVAKRVKCASYCRCVGKWLNLLHVEGTETGSSCHELESAENESPSR